MFGLENLEGLNESSLTKPQNIELSGIQREYLAEVIPDVETWKEMSVVEKLDLQETLELRMDEMRELTGVYDMDFSSVFPGYLLEECNKSFCDMIEFEDRGTMAVKEFFERDSTRDIPYSDACIEQRRAYIEDFYSNYSEFSGYDPPLLFEEMPPNSMGAYSPETNTITLNSRLLENENPKVVIETILHESRHAFQQYAIDHPWNVTVDADTIALWKDNMDYYIKPEWDFEAYQNQPIEVDADTFAERIINVGMS